MTLFENQDDNWLESQDFQEIQDVQEQTDESQKTVEETSLTSTPSTLSLVPEANALKDIPLKGIIETILFTTNRPLHIDEMADLVGVDHFEVEEALMELMNDYAFRADSALEIDDSDGYILQIRDEFKPILDKMVPMEISSAALQTLSAIAIKGPMLQSELVELRGALVYDHIPELVSKKLVTKKRDGRSYRLKVTQTFNEYFKLMGDKKDLQAMVRLMTTPNAS